MVSLATSRIGPNHAHNHTSNHANNHTNETQIVMSHPFLAIMATALLFTHHQSQAQDKPTMPQKHHTAPHGNPLLKKSTLPFQMPQFDKIKDADFAPALAEGMRRHLREIQVITNSPKPASFDNTIVAMERSAQLLNRVESIFSNLAGANTNATLQATEKDFSPKKAAHDDQVMLNAKLFQRIQVLHQKRDKLGLDAESLYLLERYYTDFVRAGAELAAADKEKLKRINTELAEAGSTFRQNVLGDVNASALVIGDRAELAGMSEENIASMAEAAKARGLTGKYLIELMNTSNQPPLAMLQNRAVRERLQQASLARGSHGGPFDNRATVLTIVKLRAERAQLLGYPNYAAYSIAEETAKTPEAANQLLAQLSPPALANARREAAALQQMIDAEKGGFQLAAHDWDYYGEKVRKANYDFDESQLRPYFELDNVLQMGVFYAANKLYGISFKERHDLPVYQADVRVFDVTDANGKRLALFLLDSYARPNKRGGAWMNQYVSQSTLLGEHPVIGNHLNILKPPAGEPTLMTLDDVVGMFHEFGHALHGMFSKVRYPRFAGTNVPRDFAEYPSQVNEMWIFWPEVLKNYAKHYQTGAAMPPALLDKFLAAKKFNQGFSLTESLAACVIDQAWHQLTPDHIPTDVPAFEADALKRAGLDFAPVPPRYRTAYFSHSMGGYAGGYYAYLWSEKLDAETVDWFKENGGLTRKNGDWFRQQLLSRGGSGDALTLFKGFRGREPTITPLLVRRGLTGEK
jgi:peptidyl-dipeptidase Dcp